jgi:hypothetical protein
VEKIMIAWKGTAATMKASTPIMPLIESLPPIAMLLLLVGKEVYPKLPWHLPTHPFLQDDYPFLTRMKGIRIAGTKERKQRTTKGRRETQERRKGVSVYPNRLMNCELYFPVEESLYPKEQKAPF